MESPGRPPTPPLPIPTSSPGNRRKRDESILELNSLLARETAKSKLRRLAISTSRPPPLFNPLCPSTTLAACKQVRHGCNKAHFDPIQRPWTDSSLGFCSYLNLCYGDPMFTKNPSLGDGPGPRGGTKDCRYQHFQVTPSTIRYSQPLPEGYPSVMPGYLKKRILGYDDVQGQSKEVNVAQWINCDLRRFDYSLLGQFQVIVADPAWDIHMTLPYGTITDDEMRNMPIRSLQPDWGIFCLWVTGRAMELGRVVFAHWGYKRVDELVWVKTNQLQRLIRTGRTGHWLNHTCEHLLVGLKIPQDFPREAPIPWDTEPALRDLRKCVDTDVVVAEVRETSRKPEEVYGVIERLVPKGRKLELFGRKHNIRPGWVTLGNQLGDSQITEPDLYDRLVKTYPKQKFTFVPPKQSSL
ncbi:mRNA methyltransferase [Cryptococcus deuterogattii R265]|uniref:mRNA methyltransferase n=1 Tax=Cryptococcus deuterogattii (strain R265) TaxID=294750 RepID=UPI0019355024|nr:mRNA methyltransferase [Cryptococcus deuterogattii R265]